MNAAKIVAIQTDERLRASVRGCELVSADGQALVWASRILGAPLPARVAGIDLMERLLALAEDRGYRVYFLGAEESVLVLAVQRIRTRHPRLRIAGSHHGYFPESESGEIAALIERSRSDILFVAMSSPRKEYWITDHRAQLGPCLSVGVGGALDVVAGVTARAPEWLQHAGLEWLFRLVQEPRRLWRRYLVSNASFVSLVAREAIARRQAHREAR